jgi:hypothetical protein
MAGRSIEPSASAVTLLVGYVDYSVKTSVLLQESWFSDDPVIVFV